MLNVTNGENEACAKIVLAPNNSAGWKGNKRFFNWIALLSLIVALAAFFSGAPVVLLFSGLELLALYFALRMVSKHCARQQVVEMTPFEVIIQSGFGRPVEQWRWQRLHTKVEIKKGRDRNLVSLCCRHQTVKIGEFLTDQELGQLIKRLRQMVSDYQRLYL